MAKPAAAAARKPSSASTVVLTLALALTTAGLLFLLLHLSPSPPSPTPQPHRHLRLRACTHAHMHHHQIPFDPIVADIERRLEDREWESLTAAELHAPRMEAAPVPDDLTDGEADADEDYINDATRLNVTLRVEVFPKIDVDPADGAVTGTELAAWNLANAQRELLHRTARELELHDRAHPLLR